MNNFFKISKYLNVFGSRNSKTRLLKKQFKAVHIFKQLIARIAFQIMLPLLLINKAGFFLFLFKEKSKEQVMKITSPSVNFSIKQNF